MQWFIDLLAGNSLLLLFVIAALGHSIGKLSFKGVSLGVSAMLFVGLALNAWNPSLTLPPVMTSLGLILFVYSIGIASGPSFFASLRRGGSGLKTNGWALGMLLLAAIAIAIIGLLWKFNPAIIAGLYTGALTNTPALAGVVQLLEAGGNNALAGLPAVGYAVAYPLGVLGPILAIAFWQRRFKIDYKKDAQRATGVAGSGKELHNKTARVTQAAYVGKELRTLARDMHWHVVFGRIKHRGQTLLSATEAYKLAKGDLVSIIGAPKDVNRIVKLLGTESDEQLRLDLSEFSRHRIVVSSKDAAGRRIRDLHLPSRYGAMITRVRRGDSDLLAHRDLVLEYGDEALVLSPRKSTSAIRQLLGDSRRETSSINVLVIGVGIALGLLVGMIPIALPGGIVFRLGDAGGPLLVGLILSSIRRTGSVVWGLPYTANLTLREFGLILMLASIGARSGQTFLSALQNDNGPLLLVGAAAISLAVPFVFLPVAYKKFKQPFAVAAGMLAATHTQPAVSAYAVQQAKNDLPSHGYAMIFPIATIGKIIIAQLLLIVLQV